MVVAREVYSVIASQVIGHWAYGYYYGGKEGAIQVICFTGQNLFGKYERDLTELLDGFVIP
jgi:hypothetical protein